MMLEVKMVVTSGESVKTGKEYKRVLSGVRGNLFLDLGARYKGIWLLCENLPSYTIMICAPLYMYISTFRKFLKNQYWLLLQTTEIHVPTSYVVLVYLAIIGPSIVSAYMTRYS